MEPNSLLRKLPTREQSVVETDTEHKGETKLACPRTLYCGYVFYSYHAPERCPCCGAIAQKENGDD